MTTPTGPSEKWPHRSQIDLNVRFPKRHRQPRRHRIWDCLGLVFAAALLSVPFPSASAVLFPILSAVFIAVYLITQRQP